MKTLKITLLLLAVLLLTVSGQSSDAVVETTNDVEYKQYQKTELLAHVRKGTKVKSQG